MAGAFPRAERTFLKVRLAEAKDTTKLIKTAIRLMIHKIGAERALVIVGENLGDQPKPKAAFGFSNKDVWNDPTVAVEALAHVLKKKRVVYTLDARKNEKFTSEKCHRSVTSVPLEYGLLYCDHPEPGAFKGSKSQMEGIAREFNLCYDLLKTQPGGREVDLDDDDEDEGGSKKKIVMAVVLLLLVGGAAAAAYFMGYLPS